MFRTHITLAAAILVAIACDDSPTSPSVPYSGAPPVQQVELIGTIELESGFDLPAIHLVQSTGDRALLLGSEAERLIALAGADVLVRGSWVGFGPPDDASEGLRYAASTIGLAVNEFVVLAVDGRTALDGVVIEADGHFALRLSDGTIHTFTDAAIDLADYVGARVWVTGSEQEPPLRYGAIR
jgi:hypothetical protein